MLTGISLFSGAGGMDVGFEAAGFETIWANDLNGDACKTFAANHRSSIRCGPISEYLTELDSTMSPDIVFGGPPCQGFSVAGKMDPDDPRSQLVYSLLEVVRRTKPRAFVLENVKALAKLDKFRGVREKLLREANELGFDCSIVVLRASDYGVPQGRERMFLVGFRDGLRARDFEAHIGLAKCASPSLRDVILPLGRAGTPSNPRVCNARVTIAARPVLRRSPYAGMLFNGQGRPLNPDGFASTLPASMGGNRTPIIDEEHLFDNEPSWVEEYHAGLWRGGSPLPFEGAPSRLRRLTIDEALRIQTFPSDYDFRGPNSAIFTQIGNAVPCELARKVAESVRSVLEGFRSNSANIGQIDFDLSLANAA